MRKVFIDAGFYAGKATAYYLPFLDEEWTIMAFEPLITDSVVQAIEKVEAVHPITVFKRAVWIADIKERFVVSKRYDANYIESVGNNAPAEVIEVECIDFSSFIKGFSEDTVIVVSMDIEGAEFEVLRKMLEDGTIDRISLLDIEFHHRLQNDETAETADALRRAIEARGVLVKLKLEL